MTDRLAPPDGGAVELTIAFFYYRDLATAIRIYEEVKPLRRALNRRSIHFGFQGKSICEKM